MNVREGIGRSPSCPPQKRKGGKGKNKEVLAPTQLRAQFRSNRGPFWPPFFPRMAQPCGLAAGCRRGAEPREKRTNGLDFPSETSDEWKGQKKKNDGETAMGERKTETAARTKTLTFKVSEAELEEIKAEALRRGKPVAEHSRDAALGQTGGDGGAAGAQIRLEKMADALLNLTRQQDALAAEMSRMTAAVLRLIHAGGEQK